MTIKISKSHSTRQVISLALEKIKADWRVVISAFGRDIGKVLSSVEILKTRVAFLHQENKLLSDTITRDDSDDPSKSKEIQLSGIQVTLSKLPFEVSDAVGYQKPKPRQFVRLYQEPEEPKKLEEVKEVKKVEPVKKEEETGEGKRKNRRRPKKGEKRSSSPEIQKDEEKSVSKKREASAKRESLKKERPAPKEPAAKKESKPEPEPVS